MENYLVHHGILGQKWGVRRYQNKDGSLTAAGQKRYDTVESAKEKAKRLGDTADKDIKKMRTQLANNKANTKAPSKQEKEAWLRKQYGEDYKNADYMKTVFEVDDPYKHAEQELMYNKTGRIERKIQNAEGTKKYFNTLLKEYSDLDVSSLSNKDFKKVEKFVKNAYINNFYDQSQDKDWNYKSYSTKYGKK